MKKQSIALTISILIASFGISQTSNDSVTCLPNAQLKAAVVLIEEGKLAKQEVVFLREKITLYDKQVLVKDTIINSLRDKDYNWRVYSQKSEQTILNLQTQVKNLDESYKLQKKMTSRAKIHRGILATFSAFCLIFTIIQLP